LCFTVELNMAEIIARFVALDLHKDYVMVAALDTHKRVVLPPRRVLLDQFAAWAVRSLQSTDQVVLEATTNAWYIYDLLEPLVARVVVADPAKAKAKMALPVKTDKRDTLGLAELLVTDSVPAVWVPPVPVRELRSLLAHRQRLVHQRTATKNRLRNLLLRHHIVPPAGELFAAHQRAWWDQQQLAPIERLRAQQDLATISHLDQLLKEVDREVTHLSGQAPWNEMVPWVLQLPGMGLLTTMTILSASGDIARFPRAKQLVGYSGLGARVHASGQTHHSGGITKQGRTELRAALVEAAWAAVRHAPHWRRQFAHFAARIGDAKAIVAIARKLLVVIWHVLTARAADRHADVPAIARRLVRWGTRYRLATLLGLSRAAFVRQQLDRLGLGAEVETVSFNGGVIRLPPASGAHNPMAEHDFQPAMV
jgi:transposase